jgi:hypothetical protein
MAEMPDLRTFAYLASFVHVRGLMYKIIYVFLTCHILLILEEPFQYIISVCKNQECQQEPETDLVCPLEELIAGFMPRDNLYQQEENVSAVKRRDWQEVHERQNDAQEGRHMPEQVPTPYGREHRTDGSEAAE